MTSAAERAFDILVVGEVNPDIIVSDPDPRPVFGQVERVVSEIHLTIGSSSVIMACAAARLGLRVAIVGVVGDDVFGRFMHEAMRDRGLDVSAVRVDPGTPTGATVILSNGRDRAILTAPGTIGAVTADDVPASLLSASPPPAHRELVPAIRAASGRRRASGGGPWRGLDDVDRPQLGSGRALGFGPAGAAVRSRHRVPQRG